MDVEIELHRLCDPLAPPPSRAVGASGQACALRAVPADPVEQARSALDPAWAGGSEVALGQAAGDFVRAGGHESAALVAGLACAEIQRAREVGRLA